MTFPAVFNLSSLNGTNGFAINGINANDQSGRSVSNAGDINGDGFDDVIIGTHQADPNGSYSGQSYVVFGKSSGFSASLNLSTLNGTNGFAINGINASDYSGFSVSSAGDINGDGFDDLIIGAFGADPNGIVRAGQSYIVFGKSGGFNASLNLSTLNGTNGFAINGIYYNDFSGVSVSSAGDINGDGFDDVIIGAHQADPNGSFSGQSYVVFGKSSGFSASLNLSTLNGTNGFAINGINAGDLSGASVSNAGDINGDGFDDLIIGAFSANPNGDSSGQSYVVFGKSGGFSDSLNLSTLNGTNGFAINGISAIDFSGASVSNAGDINGDGFDDLIIGAPGTNPNSGIFGGGQSYVVFGKSGGFSASLNLSTLNGSNGFAINGINANDGSGRSVSSAGDFNGDGFDDLIIGASGADPNDSYSGQSYVVFGKSGSFSDSLNLSTLNGTNGFAINGINAYDYSARSVSSAGDINGDGFDDLIIGAFQADPNGIVDAGQSYVIFGQATASTLPSITLAISPVSVREDGTGNIIYTFTRTGVLTNPLTVNYGITGTATNGVDYGTIGTSVTFAANSATTTVKVNPTPDTTVEANETVILTLASNAAYTIGTTGAVTGTITNDEIKPIVALSLDYSGISENSTTNFTYTFTRTGNLTNALTVNFNVSGTATFSTDYEQTGANNFTSPTKTVTFVAGSATANVVINPTRDTTVESNETVILKLTSGTEYVRKTTSAVTATIINDDETRNQIATNGNDVILGKNKKDEIVGGLGNDILTGGGNADLFIFQNPNEGIDRITDFTPSDDLIVIGSSFGGGLISSDIIKSTQFVIGTTATTAKHRFIYNSATGALLFDQDGKGAIAAIQFATLNTGLALTYEDIFVS
ncbi:hypothetical protein C7H19_01890 [Aphanothece hegewaldii CCALA 016]|uniref:Calx-beta domain-containing protein n=1 Tax=Aphanothece hegewaldii CCALA 016 TaxID=2107694 RepID=A0A2T1M404_9CHRO|nr:Calx-beta domain-containing protein [Aphanothece hegewaldii]PSF39565.1 hypothetical protein C7H19_01890 [Aphanothece hegewaldii CCALA 016]